MEKLFRCLKRAAAAVFGCVVIAGCATVPPPEKQEASVEQRMAADVEFLAQPALKGRESGTHGAHLAREFIKARFKSCGLVPWGNASDYELSFGYGKNIIGVLPGSDTNVANEIVLLSAHYDHEGKKHGKIYPGAADNASGVAALLEAARELSRQRPQRTVAFAAFDSEERMMLGSFAFANRKDVADARIVGVVNMDMLGRDFLDVVRHSLFVAGTESYPDLRRQVRGLGTNAGIRVLPIGTDLVGPRSDHVAFESRGVPCLFFSCGSYRDYHQPTDTPDKLNYADIERSSRVVIDTVRDLAGAGRVPESNGADFNAEELQTLSTVLSEAAAGAARAGIRKADVEQFQKLEATARERLNSGHYDRDAREQFAAEAVGTLTPYLLPFGNSGNLSGPQREQTAAMMEMMQAIYFNYRKEVVEGYRQLVAQLLQYRPGAFRGMPGFHYEIYQIAERDIRMTDRGNGRWELNAFALPTTLDANIKTSPFLIKRFSGGISFNLDVIDCAGPRDQIADFCLLELRAQQTNAMRFEQEKKLLGAATGAAVDGNYPELLAKRLERGGFDDEGGWIASCALSGNPNLMGIALAADALDRDGRIHQAACKLIVDRSVRLDVRAAAIRCAARKPDRDTMLACCAVLGDVDPLFRWEYYPWCSDDYVFADRPVIKLMRSLAKSDQFTPVPGPRTIGTLAKAQLMKASGKDFGADEEKWRRWIDTHFGTGSHRDRLSALR
jgi:hypothetical protein